MSRPLYTFLILTVILCGGYYYFLFTFEATEAQKTEVTSAKFSKQCCWHVNPGNLAWASEVTQEACHLSLQFEAWHPCSEFPHAACMPAFSFSSIYFFWGSPFSSWHYARSEDGWGKRSFLKGEGRQANNPFLCIRISRDLRWFKIASLVQVRAGNM